MRRTRTRALTQSAWIAIMLITGGFQLYRGALPDGIVFLTLGLALILDAARILPAISRRPRVGLASRGLLIGGIAVAAAVLALTPRHGIADGIVLVASGILVVIVAWPGTMHAADSAPAPAPTEPTPWTTRMTRSAALWAGIGIVVCLWELTMYFLGAYLPGGGRSYPALSDLLDPLIQNPIGRILFVTAWLLGGLALTRRGRDRTNGKTTGIANGATSTSNRGIQ